MTTKNQDSPRMESTFHPNSKSRLRGQNITIHPKLEPTVKKKLEGLSPEEIMDFVLLPENRKAGLSIIRSSINGDEPGYMVTSISARKDDAERQLKERVDKVLGRMVEVLPSFAGKAEEVRKEIDRQSCTGCKLNGILQRTAVSYVEMCKAANVDPDVASFSFSPQDARAVAKAVTNRAAEDRRAERLLNRTPSVGGPRPSCADCFRKHIGKAIVQLEETELGYPQHFWLAMANLSEAEAESLTEWPDLAREVREVRLDMTDDRTYKPDLMQFFDKIDELTKEIEKE